MNKKRESIPPYAYIDSQRLREAFFSPQKSKKKNLPRKIILFSAIFVAFLSFTFFLLKYTFIIIPREDFPIGKNDISFLRDNEIAAIKYSDSNNVKIKHSSIHIVLEPYKKEEITINLKKTLNLNTYFLFIGLRESAKSLKIDVVARDSNFFSNSLKPLIIETGSAKDKELLYGDIYSKKWTSWFNVFDNIKRNYIKIPVTFENTYLQNVHLAQVNQIKLYFSSLDKDKKNNILIKDLVLIKKEVK